jgi:hypothetical protein
MSVSRTVSAVELLEAASMSEVGSIPSFFPSLSTLQSLASDSASKKFLDSVESRVNLILKSPDQKKLLEQTLLFAFLVRQRPARQAPRPSLEEAVGTYFSTGRGVLRDIDEVQRENEQLKTKVAVLERLLPAPSRGFLSSDHSRRGVSLSDIDAAGSAEL